MSAGPLVVTYPMTGRSRAMLASGLLPAHDCQLALPRRLGEQAGAEDLRHIARPDVGERPQPAVDVEIMGREIEHGRGAHAGLHHIHAAVG